MIRDYEIKNIDNHEILYIYLDYYSEFAKLCKKSKKKKLKTYLEEFVKRNKINFTGSIVAIMMSGFLIDTIILNEDINNSFNTNYIVNIVNNDLKIIEKETEKEELLEGNVTKEDVILNTNKDIVFKEDVKVELKKEENPNNLENSKIVVENDSNNLVKSGVNVKIYRKNNGILNIDLEEYLIGVIASEMPAEFNIEALKAQSIISRTYTLKSIKDGKRLTDDSSTQNYKSDDELKDMWGKSYNKYYEKIKEAVESTRGIYLSYKNDYIEAVYHSTSNGKTENSIYVWGNAYPYLVSVDSEYDTSNKNFSNTIFLSYETLSNILGENVNNETIFNIVSRNESGRVKKIVINEKNYTGVEFRLKLGIRSSDFDIEKINDGINVTTRGYGHGVGMSQYGANGMAKNGASYKDILYHYYPGTNLSYMS